MKRYLVAVAVLAFASALPVTAAAQGRHDEKPHGVTKAAPKSPDQSRAAATGGRHDEGGSTHGKKKTAAKKEPAATESSK